MIQDIGRNIYDNHTYYDKDICLFIMKFIPTFSLLAYLQVDITNTTERENELKENNPAVVSEVLCPHMILY